MPTTIGSDGISSSNRALPGTILYVRLAIVSYLVVFITSLQSSPSFPVARTSHVASVGLYCLALYFAFSVSQYYAELIFN